MRPGVSLDNNIPEPSRSRKPSNAESSSLATTFFLSRDHDGAGRPQHSERTLFSDSPVSSLQDAIQEADRCIRHHHPRSSEAPARSGSRRRSTIKPSTAERFLRRESSGASTSANVETASSTQNPSSDKENKRTVTPPPFASRDVSLSSSPKSLASRESRLKSSSASDDDLSTSADETGSQAVLSSGDEDENEVASNRVAFPKGSQMDEGAMQDSQPELIMPSIKMPSRRPFTSRGTHLGRFKIMVAGRKGMHLRAWSSTVRC